MLNDINGTLLGGRIKIQDILNCFEAAMPDSIILGGSCVNEENNISTIKGEEYYLSDIDLLCIRETPFTETESNSIYRNMLEFKLALKQKNPYFHIGLKLRGNHQLKNEVRSMYFRELSEQSSCLIGNDFLSYFDSNTVFGFFTDDQENLKSTLLSCAITRLWCNVLFYPVNLLESDEQYYYQVWYNYFYSRGCLDWVTFRLIAEQRWAPGYRDRYFNWKSIDGLPADEERIIPSCLKTKLGEANLNYKSIFSTGVDMGERFCKKFCLPHRGSNDELDFVITMNRYIESVIDNNIEYSYALVSSAMNSFGKLSGTYVSLKAAPDESWLELRKLYSEFRFCRAPRDRLDHEVYTKHFLDLSERASIDTEA